MSRILFMTNVIRSLGMMQQALEQLQQEGKLPATDACQWITEETVWDGTWQERLQAVDLVYLKWMGTGLDTPFLRKAVDYLKLLHKKFYIDAAGSDVNELTNELQPEQIILLRDYAIYGGEENYYNLWQYMDQLLSGRSITAPAPQSLHWCGIYHPRAQKVYTDVEEYFADFCVPGRPTVGLLFYRDEWVWGDLTYQAALIEEAEAQGMNIISVFTNGQPVEEMGIPSLSQVCDKFFFHSEATKVDVLLNAIKFSSTSSGSLSLASLKRYDVPLLEVYTIMSTYEDWEKSFEGMNAMEVSISVSLPEFDGVIHGVPVASKKLFDNGDIRYLPIAERIGRMVSKAKKWANLKRKPNSEKKIAIIFHNYPPRNSNIGSAFGLDSIESVRCLLARMQAQGYKIDHLPVDTKEFIEELTANATNDKELLSEKQIARAAKVTKEEYLKFFNTMPQKVQEQLTKDWGRAPGDVMEFDGSLLVPGTMNGNVFITVQAPRGFGDDPSKIYHSPYCAPTHHYLAFYQWIRDIWQADAVAHIGTHGSLEWLPGKNAGLSNGCYPDLALGDLPNIYPYNMTITGEGIQAKRRGAACIIEHLPAPQAQAGVYDELEELEKVMDEYLDFRNSQPEQLDRLEQLVLEKVEAANLQEEVSYDLEQPFDEYISNLHNYITDLKNMEVHTGLHILGQVPEAEGLTEYLWILTRLENGSVPSLNQVLCGYHGLEYYQLLENTTKVYTPLQITYAKLLDRITEQSHTIITLLQEGNFTSEAVATVLQLPWVQRADQTVQESLRKICSYICETLYPNLCLTAQEQTNVLRGLSAGYVEPGPSGSPTSGGADLLPTGRNFYGVDPRTLPTPAAWELGQALGDRMIEQFIMDEGRYPENVGIVLWSGANMRSHGQCVAEFLYLLGLKPLYQSCSLRVKDVEVIPLAELKRPRIDVTARISGLFRDTMPSIVNLLDNAVLKVAGLADEPLDMNYVRKHIVEDSRELEEQGLSREDAWRQAAFRIFGDEQGVYGAGVSNLLEAKNWETIDDIADVFVRWGAHAYGGKFKGKFLPQQFRKRLGVMDVTIKNEDNHETNMLSSDDFNAYHGGMIAAVRSIKGSAPRSYCGDTADRNKVQVRSLQEQAKRLFRSECINPKFIEGMMKHGYKGAADLANMVAHSYQWDATSDVLEDWMYEEYAKKYTFDPKVQDWLRDVNPWALQRMAEVLLEADQRGLWKAQEETKLELQKIYLSIEGEIEERSDENS